MTFLQSSVAKSWDEMLKLLEIPKNVQCAEKMLENAMDVTKLSGCFLTHNRGKARNCLRVIFIQRYARNTSTHTARMYCWGLI